MASAAAGMQAMLQFVQGCEELPVASREMVALGVVPALAGSGRHEFQERFLKATQEVLAGLESTFAERRRSIAQALEEAMAGQQDAEQAGRAAQKAAEDAAELSAKKASVAAAAEKEAATIRQELTKATEQHKRFDGRMVSARKGLGHAQEVQDGPLRTLVSAAWTDEAARDSAMEAVLGFLKNLGAEAALLAAVPGALGSKARSGYCELVVLHVQKAVAAFLEQQRETLSEGEGPAWEAKAEMLGLWALHDYRLEQAAQKANEASDAQAVSKDAETVVVQAAAEVKQRQEQVAQRQQAAAQLEQRQASWVQAMQFLDEAMSAPSPQSKDVEMTPPPAPVDEAVTGVPSADAEMLPAPDATVTISTA